MSSLLAFFQLAMLFVSSLLLDGSPRYFEVSPKEGNAELVVTLDASALYNSGKANTFIWTLGNGDSLTTTFPTINYTYSTPGSFTVKLDYQFVENDKKGRVKIKHQKDAGSVNIIVHPKPNIAPIASLNCSAPNFLKLKCSPVGSTDEDGRIISYKYEWGDQNFDVVSEDGEQEHHYLTAGEKTVRLTITDDKGASHSVEKTYQIKENSKPTAGFICEKTNFLSITCQSTSSDPDEELENFEWKLDDGTVYSTKSFNHTFNIRPVDVAISSHNIALKVTDKSGLSDIFEKIVEVDLEPIKESPRGYFKAFIDGTYVSLRAFIAKTQFNTKKAYYQIFDEQNNHLQTIPLTDFYQNNLVRVNLEKYANYRVTLTVVDYRDQIFSTTRQIPLVEDTSSLAPFVNFRAVQSNVRTIYINLNQSFDYDENYSINEFVINFGNGEIRSLKTDTFYTYTYTESGTYSISVTAKTNHGTERTFTQTVTVTDDHVTALRPDPTFAYRIYSFAQNVSFYNEKSGTPNGEIISYHWDFGDGTSAYGETQAHFYLPGEYLVTLTVVDSAGLSSSQIQKINITNTGDDIVAHIDCDQRLPYLDITQLCKVNALDKFNEISRIRVVWGDGSVFTLATPFDPRQGVYYPQKKYNEEGTFPIRLIANTLRGDFKIHDISRTITARRPVANLHCYVNNLLVFCDALASYDPKGLPLTYTFDFGNGQVESNSTGVLTYSYPEAGLYTVTLKVEDTTGLNSQTTTQVQPVEPPNQLPIAKFNCDSLEPHTLNCWDEGTFDPDGNIAIKKLIFDDGRYDFLDSSLTLRHQFNEGGIHEVKLIVIDEDGGESFLIKSFDVKISNPPVADFQCFTPGPQRLSCYSTSYDSDEGDLPVKFTWDFGDSNIQSELTSTFDHVYSFSGNVDVSLKVEDKYGKSSSLTKSFTLQENQAPIIALDCKVSLGDTYQCDANSSDEDGEIISHQFSINGAVVGSSNSLIYNFTNGGEYRVGYRATDNLGKESMAVVSVVIDKPVAKFGCIETEPLTVNCKADPDMLTEEILLIKYTFDDFEVIKGPEAIHSFSHFGLHKVQVSILSKDGRQASQEIILNFPEKTLLPKPRFNYDVQTGYEVIFNGAESLFQERSVAKYEWKFSEGDIFESSGANNKITKAFPGEGTYSVTLKVTDPLGQTAAYTKQVYIYNSEVPDPGEAGNETIGGIDSDSDGVRDDVQRWIAFESKENIRLKFALKKLAKTYQENMLKYGDINLSRNLLVKKAQIESCLRGILNDEIRYDHLSSMMEYIHFYSPERAPIRYEIIKNMAGLNYPEMPMILEGQMDQCKAQGI